MSFATQTPDIIREVLKAQYPLISSSESDVWRLVNVVNNFTSINKFVGDIKYCEELELFYSNLYKAHRQILKGHINTVRNTANFDISKVQDLPEDIIGVIKSYIEPEIEFVKKFTIIDTFVRFHRKYASGSMERWLTNVPKEIIVDLIKYNFMFRVGDGPNNKSSWCEFVYNKLQELTEDYNVKSVSSLMIYNERCSHSRIPLLYRFLLRMKVFIDYRYKLEANKKANKEKLDKLKKTKILVNK